MTKLQLQSLEGFHAPTLLAAALHLRTTMRRRGEGSDTTALVNNEGRINGYLEAIEALEIAASPTPPAAPKKEHQPYSQPPGFQRPNENQNRP